MGGILNEEFYEQVFGNIWRLRRERRELMRQRQQLVIIRNNYIRERENRGETRDSINVSLNRVEVAKEILNKLEGGEQKKIIQYYINFMNNQETILKSINTRYEQSVSDIPESEFDLINKYKLIQEMNFVKLRLLRELKENMIQKAYTESTESMLSESDFNNVLLQLEQFGDTQPPSYDDNLVPKYTQEDVVPGEYVEDIPPYIGNEIGRLEDYLNKIREDIKIFKKMNEEKSSTDLVDKLEDLKKTKNKIKTRINKVNLIAKKHGKEWKRKSRERRKTRENNVKRLLRRTIERRRRRRRKESNPFLKEEEKLEILIRKEHIINSDILSIENILSNMLGDENKRNKLESLLKDGKNKRISILKEIDTLKPIIKDKQEKNRNNEQETRRKAAEKIQKSFRRSREKLQRQRKDMERQARIDRLSGNKFRMSSNKRRRHTRLKK
jgi:hypothetical protein